MRTRAERSPDPGVPPAPDPVGEAPAPEPRPRRLPGILLFFLCATLLVPHLFYMYVVERELFSRIYVLPVTLLFVAFIQYFALTDRDWLFSRRYLKTKICVVVIFLLLPRTGLVGSIGVLTMYGLSKLLLLYPPIAALPPSLWRGRARLVVVAVLFLGLFPLMNYLTLVIGPFRQLSPPVLSEHPLFEINEAGFRGPLVPRERDPSRPRLLFLGDSSTFGFPYPNAAVYPTLVGELLEEEGFGEVEVVNAGIVGQSLVQVPDRLDSLLAYEPDVVVMMFGYHQERAERDAESLRSPSDYSDHSLTLRFQPPLLLHLVTWDLFQSPWLGYSSEKPVGDVELVRGALQDVIERVAVGGRRLVVLEYPSPEIPEVIQTALRETALERGQIFVPLIHLFEDESDYAQDDWIHPNRASHRRVAETVVEVIRPLLRERAVR